MAAELLADEKERAEHVMLVDLGRNDVGRVAEFGTVAVTELMVVERYSHVLHIVSQVEGRIPADGSAIDVFRATFPAGTMTGAPKVRAMEIIDELEPERRGPYAGAVGYIAAGDRRMDLAITIRTCVLANGVASVQARRWDRRRFDARARVGRDREQGAGAARGDRAGALRAGSRTDSRRRTGAAGGRGLYILTAMPYTLTSVEGGQSFDLKMGGALVVGRALTSDIPVFDPTISRRHAELVRRRAWRRASETSDRATARSSTARRSSTRNCSRATSSRSARCRFDSPNGRRRRRREAPAERRRPGRRGADAAQQRGARITGDHWPPRRRRDIRAACDTVRQRRDSGCGTIVRQLRVPESGPQGLAAALRGQSTATGTAAHAQRTVAQATDDRATARIRSATRRSWRCCSRSPRDSRASPTSASLLDKIAGFCLQIFDVDYVSVLLADERGEQVPKVARDRQGAAPQRSVPQSIVRTGGPRQGRDPVRQRAGGRAVRRRVDPHAARPVHDVRAAGRRARAGCSACCTSTT